MIQQPVRVFLLNADVIKAVPAILNEILDNGKVFGRYILINKTMRIYLNLHFCSQFITDKFCVIHFNVVVYIYLLLEKINIKP